MQADNEMSKEERINELKAEASARARQILQENQRRSGLSGKIKGMGQTSGMGTGASSQPVRAINEDDDGYDPYSDFHDQVKGEPLFQRNPWE